MDVKYDWSFVDSELLVEKIVPHIGKICLIFCHRKNQLARLLRVFYSISLMGSCIRNQLHLTTVNETINQSDARLHFNLGLGD